MSIKSKNLVSSGYIRADPECERVNRDRSKTGRDKQGGGLGLYDGRGVGTWQGAG